MDLFPLSCERSYIQIAKILELGINPYRAGTELSRINYVNIMAADVLAPFVGRTSAAIILTI